MRVCIYTTKEQKRKLTEMMYRYQLSRSTIASILLFTFTKYALRQENKDELIAKIGTKYIYEQKGDRTYINVRKDPTNQGMYENLTKAYTNLIAMYEKGDIKNYIENKQGFYNDLNKKLQQEQEPNWNYNQFRRQMAKYEQGKNKNEGNLSSK